MKISARSGRLGFRPQGRLGFRPLGRGGFRPQGRGFTLLELVIAITILASFVLPMLLILSKSKMRALKMTQQRQVRDLAQRRLFDRVHYYLEEDSGDFALEGRPEWTWEIAPPEMIGSGEQVLLEYRIQVYTPQKIGSSSGSGSSSGAFDENAGTGARGIAESLSADGEGSVYELSVWTFPDDQWYLEQDDLFSRGLYSPLYGDPTLSR